MSMQPSAPLNPDRPEYRKSRCTATDKPTHAHRYRYWDGFNIQYFRYIHCRLVNVLFSYCPLGSSRYTLLSMKQRLHSFIFIHSCLSIPRHEKTSKMEEKVHYLSPPNLIKPKQLISINQIRCVTATYLSCVYISIFLLSKCWWWCFSGYWRILN